MSGHVHIPVPGQLLIVTAHHAAVRLILALPPGGPGRPPPFINDHDRVVVGQVHDNGLQGFTRQVHYFVASTFHEFYGLCFQGHLRGGGRFPSSLLRLSRIYCPSTALSRAHCALWRLPPDEVTVPRCAEVQCLRPLTPAGSSPSGEHGHVQSTDTRTLES